MVINVVKKLNETLDGGIGEYDIDEVHSMLEQIIKSTTYVNDNIETYYQLERYLNGLNKCIKRLEDIKDGKYFNPNWDD